MKVCKDCKTEKKEEDFYGVQGECKSCTKKRVKARRDRLKDDPNWLKSERERNRLKYHRLGYKDKHKPTPEAKAEAMRKYNEKYPEKLNARRKSQRMKPKAKGNELHHWSYKEENVKDVIEIGIMSHNLIHRNMEYDQEFMCYRTLDGTLLDTKQKSIEFYESLGVIIH